MSIALSIGNNLTTGGVFTADAVNNTSVTNVTDFASVPGGGVLKLLSTQTASSSASLEFSMDGTYDSYVFKFINIHPQNDGVRFQFNLSTDNGSNYNVTKTTTFFYAYHGEADSPAGLGYEGALDLAQSTGFQPLSNSTANTSSKNVSGNLQLFNPSSSVFVKHFISIINSADNYPISVNSFIAGYGNTTSPVTNLKFQFSSGNIDDGIIKMYGVS